MGNDNLKGGGEAYTMSDREKLKKLAEAVKDLPWDDRLGVWQDYWAGTDPSTILALLSELEQAERERERLVDELASAEISHQDFREESELQYEELRNRTEELLQKANDALFVATENYNTSEAALRTLRQAAEKGIQCSGLKVTDYEGNLDEGFSKQTISCICCGAELNTDIHTPECHIAALAAALAAEGGK